jgi:exo-beta-1,3-glucanase (GH17 family)/cellulose synthase/poly-beta-1,6-N-acetylglucosamine synthase-like glycosyltransferase
MNRNSSTGVLLGVLLAAVLAVGNLLAWAVWHRPVAMPETAPAVEASPAFGGLAYNAFQRWDSPIAQRYPDNAAIDADLRRLAGMTGRIRTYSASEFPDLPAIAARHGLVVTAGVWLDGSEVADRREIDAVKEAVRLYRNIERVIVGNETLLHGALGLDRLTAHLRELRRALRVPVSTAEPWHVWLRHPELARHVDFIAVHLLPYWEGVPAEHAVDYALERYAQIRAAFPNKHVVIGEIGWPSRGDRITRNGSSATASPLEQARFTREFLARVQDTEIDYFVMEAIDQPWKAANEGRVGAYWGLLHADRSPKFALTGPLVADPHWQDKAIVSSLLGLVAMLAFALRFAWMRAPSRLVYCVALQAVATFVTVLAGLALQQYLRPSDALVFAVLGPTLALAIAVLLAGGFEFVELFWGGNLRRRFDLRPLPAGAPEPKVSLHLACCNEPPAMVIATLESLAALQWSNYEVLVVDNNTGDPALWEPVRDWVAQRDDPRFRFFHLPRWPGFKAGALNFALTHTAADAQIVGVVDADYLVRRDWLHALSGHFADPAVAVVQCPQAHRDWQHQPLRRMMNFEYDGFFRIGMHHRNERDAIIQHGTMTLIRAQALRAHGGWSEWTICEDAELGLRLMSGGLRTVYVDRVMGQGLTPEDFAQFRKQRRRWAQGAMQILRGHARMLFGRSRLSLAQRYHFVSGWLPWIGDALHLAFTFGAMTWTIGLVAAPARFDYPIALFMVPLLAFFALRALIGPLLYWRRVGCAPAEIAGAAVAGMALSHAVALGVFAGLSQRRAVFEITRKAAGPTPGATGRAQAPIPMGGAREEALLALGLGVCGLAVALTREPGHPESALWLAVLALQSVPYLAAGLCAALARWPQARRGPAQTPEAAAPILQHYAPGGGR